MSQNDSVNEGMPWGESTADAPEPAPHPVIDELHDSCVAHTDDASVVGGWAAGVGAASGTAAAGEFLVGGALASEIEGKPQVADVLYGTGVVLLDKNVEGAIGLEAKHETEGFVHEHWGDVCDGAATGLTALDDIAHKGIDYLESVGAPSYVEDKLGYDPNHEAAPDVGGSIFGSNHEDHAPDTSIFDVAPPTHDSGSLWGGSDADSSASDNHDTSSSWGSSDSGTSSSDSGGQDAGGSGSSDGS